VRHLHVGSRARAHVVAEFLQKSDWAGNMLQHVPRDHQIRVEVSLFGAIGGPLDGHIGWEVRAVARIAYVEAKSSIVPRTTKLAEKVAAAAPDLHDALAREVVPLPELFGQALGEGSKVARVMQGVFVLGSVLNEMFVEVDVVNVSAALAKSKLHAGPGDI